MDTTTVVNSPGVFAVVMLFTVAYVVLTAWIAWRGKTRNRCLALLFLAAPATAYCVFFAATTRTVSSLLLVAIWSMNIVVVSHGLWNTYRSPVGEGNRNGA